MSERWTQRLQDRVDTQQMWEQTSSQGGSECGGGNHSGALSSTQGSSLSPLGLSLEGEVETSFLCKRPPDRGQALSLVLTLPHLAVCLWADHCPLWAWCLQMYTRVT